MQIIKISNDIVEIDDIRYSIKEAKFAPCRLCCFCDSCGICKLDPYRCMSLIGQNCYLEKINIIYHSPTLPMNYYRNLYDRKRKICNRIGEKLS
jgi:hypothetical protein